MRLQWLHNLLTQAVPCLLTGLRGRQYAALIILIMPRETDRTNTLKCWGGISCQTYASLPRFSGWAILLADTCKTDEAGEEAAPRR